MTNPKKEQSPEESKTQWWKVTVFPVSEEPYDAVARDTETLKKLVGITARFAPTTKIIIEAYNKEAK